MNRSHLRNQSVILAGVSILAGAATVVVNLAVASEAGAAVAAQLSILGLVALAVGLVAGFPVLVIGGVLGLVFGSVAAVSDSDALFDLRTTAVVPLVWLAFEVAMRSCELRPATRSSRTVVVDWLGGVATVAAGSAALALVASVVVSAAPAGGLTFRVLSIVAVVAVVVAVAAVNLARQVSGRAGNPRR
ncbi:MAG: hypothetical protein ACLFRV_07015 [Acidimicrobiales bacterium]